MPYPIFALSLPRIVATFGSPLIVRFFVLPVIVIPFKSLTCVVTNCGNVLASQLRTVKPPTRLVFAGGVVGAVTISDVIICVLSERCAGVSAEAIALGATGAVPSSFRVGTILK